MPIKDCIKHRIIVCVGVALESKIWPDMDQIQGCVGAYGIGPCFIYDWCQFRPIRVHAQNVDERSRDARGHAVCASILKILGCI